MEIKYYHCRVCGVEHPVGFGFDRDCQIERALTRTARKAFRKARLGEDFIRATCHVWFPGYTDKAVVGNNLAYSGSLSNKAKRRLLNIIPHVRRAVQKTAVACGYKGEFEWDILSYAHGISRSWRDSKEERGN